MIYFRMSSGDEMRSKFFSIVFVFIGLLDIACSKSEKLDTEEMQYVKTTIAITNARIASKDSIEFTRKIDSVYKKFGTSKDDYIKTTTNFSQQPDRAGIVFRAIADSLNIK